MKTLRALLDKYLDPCEQLTELLAGLLMVLMIMGWARTAFEPEGPDDDRTREERLKESIDWLQSALACNVVWGLIMGLMNTMNRLYNRSRPLRLQCDIGDVSNAEAFAIVEDELDGDLADITTEEERHALCLRIVERIKTAAMPRTMLQWRDLTAAFIIFCLVTVTAIPAYIPFLFSDILLGIRVANLVLVSLLFIVGYCWGRLVLINAWLAGTAILVIGVAMVGVAEWLGAG